MSKTFVDNIKEKKKIKARKKLELIEEESGWDTFIEWVLTNWLTLAFVVGAACYWGYNRVTDYLEERQIRIEAETKLEIILDRTKDAEKKIEKFRSDLEKARHENEQLRSKIEDLTPAEKKQVILDQIGTLKRKMNIVKQKSLKEKLEDKIYKVLAQ